MVNMARLSFLFVAQDFAIDVDRYYRSPFLVAVILILQILSSYYINGLKNTTTTIHYPKFHTFQFNYRLLDTIFI